jgi:hypothetical protein
MNEELITILAHTDATNTDYIIKDLEHIELKTSSDQRLNLQSDHFYLGVDEYHIAGTPERIVVVDKAIDLLANDVVLRTHDGNITIQNISTAPEDVNSTIELTNNEVNVSGNAVAITAPNGFYMNGTQIILPDGLVEEGSSSLVSSGTLFETLKGYVKEVPAAESEITENGTNAVNSKAVIAYTASALSHYSTTSETIDYVAEQITQEARHIITLVVSGVSQSGSIGFL